MSMGPFRMLDLVGLDLGWRARKLSGTESPITAKINDALCEMDRYGQKNGKGFYNYVEGSRAPHPAPENEAIYEQVSKDNGFERREISDQEIIDRCILALVNEEQKSLKKVLLNDQEIWMLYILMVMAFQFGEEDQCSMQIWKVLM